MVPPGDPTVKFQIGESVRVTAGTFKGFCGRIVSIDEQRDFLTVELTDTASPVDDARPSGCRKVAPLCVAASQVQRLDDTNQASGQAGDDARAV